MAGGWTNSTRSQTLPADWRTVRRPRTLRRDDYVCQLRYQDCCTVTATDIDHIGDRDDHSDDNLQASCSECNQLKNLRTRPRLASRRRPTEPHPGIRHAE